MGLRVKRYGPLSTMVVVGRLVGTFEFLCFRIREHGDKAKSIWTHLDDSASEWSSFLGRRFLPLGSPASAGLFRTPALPKLNRSPSEAPVSQSCESYSSYCN